MCVRPQGRKGPPWNLRRESNPLGLVTGPPAEKREMVAIVRSFQSDRGIDQEAERGEIRFRKPRGRLLKIYTKTAS